MFLTTQLRCWFLSLMRHGEENTSKFCIEKGQETVAFGGKHALTDYSFLLQCDSPQHLGHILLCSFFLPHTARVIEKTTMIYKPAETPRITSNNNRVERNELTEQRI